MSDKLQIWWVSEKAYISSHERHSVKPGTLIVAIHIRQDRFILTSGKIFHLYHEKSRYSGATIEIFNISHVNSQDHLDFLNMMHPGAGFDNVKLKQVLEMKAKMGFSDE